MAFLGPGFFVTGFPNYDHPTKMIIINDGINDNRK